MELVTKQMRVDARGKQLVDQFYMDEDINVPDHQADMARVVYSTGETVVEDIKHAQNHLTVMGKLHYQILYVTDESESRPASLEGRLPFEETLYIDEGETEGHFVVQRLRTEFTSTMVHPRKLTLKAMIELVVAAEGTEKEEVATDIEGEEKLLKKTNTYALLQLHTQKKDTYRIKEEMELPGTGETIGKVLWSDVALRKTDSRLRDNELEVSGEIQAFCLYESAEGKTDWTEQTISYEGRVECPQVTDAMFHHLQYQLSDVVVEARPDSDGEMRVIGVEGTLELFMTIYEEEQIELLEDVYSLQKDCKIERNHRIYDRMLLQNHSKCKITEQLSLPELKEDILQICHSGGEVQVVSVEPVAEGLQMEGLLHINFLYVKTDDRVPYDTWQGMVPFSYTMECGQLSEATHHDMTAGLEQLTVSLMGGNQIEVRAVLAFDAFFRNHVPVDIITDITASPYDITELEQGAGVIGYIVREGDDLWKLAKNYRTTKESIMEVNEMAEERLAPGQKILILKENAGIL